MADYAKAFWAVDEKPLNVLLNHLQSSTQQTNQILGLATNLEKLEKKVAGDINALNKVKRTGREEQDGLK